MSKLKIFVLALLVPMVCSVKADEGMWLLQLMQEQNSIDMMKKQGLKLNATDIYNPNGVSLKDAVGIFGGGCTGEIISAEGLILTNHHCGYESIQQHSSVEHDYLTNGFWAKSRSEELATPGLKFTFIERIVDITDIVNAQINSKKITLSESFGQPYLSKLAKELYNKSDLKGKPGIVPLALPFYAGNKYYLFYEKIYSDVRMVAAPPSSVGKFGGETDNWMWPRHTGDFSIFRIYAKANGDPADYSPSNVPLKTKKHLTISLKGVKEGDYAMVMGFPGRTSRYLTESEVKERMEAVNDPRIRIRTARLEVLKEEMAKSDKIRIQYASKFAQSSNYWKNSIGMNKAILSNHVLDTKAAQEQRFEEYAKQNNKPEYLGVVDKINKTVEKTKDLIYRNYCLMETYMAMEFFTMPFDMKTIQDLSKALEKKDQKTIKKCIGKMTVAFNNLHNQDYDHEVDRKIAKKIIPLYAELTPENELPAFYGLIKKDFNGSYDAFIDAMYNNSIFSSKENFDKFVANPTAEALKNDLNITYTATSMQMAQQVGNEYSKEADGLNELHKTYIRGLGEMKQPVPSYPDANFTLRLTYGNVKSYSPRDGVAYNYYTTADGILQKEDPKDKEFVVPSKLKSLIQNRDFGRYALPNGEMPVCFLTTNDITGGNSGSPVMNATGELIGTAFDGNWESLSGDINFDNKLQRCICLDVRYTLFIIDKLGGCKNLIDEMTIDQ